MMCEFADFFLVLHSLSPGGGDGAPKRGKQQPRKRLDQRSIIFVEKNVKIISHEAHISTAQTSP
jgi:hypothetical protein